MFGLVVFLVLSTAVPLVVSGDGGNMQGMYDPILKYDKLEFSFGI